MYEGEGMKVTDRNEWWINEAKSIRKMDMLRKFNVGNEKGICGYAFVDKIPDDVLNIEFENWN